MRGARAHRQVRSLSPRTLALLRTLTACTVRSAQTQEQRQNFSRERSLNSETFGQSAVRSFGGRMRYRGRGGGYNRQRGGGGRSYAA